tara:strand:+ start:5848 stop:6606 length:759 start_codon:yes stop_codon:yes gene_type:complete
MADTYEINDKAPEEDISLEEQAANLPDEEDNGDRPDWLPEKFKSPEDLAAAYQNLESKLGSDTDSGETEDLPPTEAPDESESSQTETILAASDEWQEKGELSVDTYKSLADAGLSKELVDSYIQGQQALQSSEEDALMDIVGGREAYTTVSEWAAESLSESQLDAYNKAVSSGTTEQAKLAVDWLKSKHDAANGTNPALIQGRTQGSSNKPFESRAQILEAMALRDANGNKKYELDSAYRAEVERRLAISNI